MVSFVGDMLLSVLLPFALFFPGYFLLSWITRRWKTLLLSTLDRILAGALLWLFLLVGISTVVGILTTYLAVVFDSFLFVSVAILCIGTVEVFRHGIPGKKLEHIPIIIIPVMLLLLVLFLATYFQSPFYQYDANKIYLPYTLAITKTGGIQNDPYRLTNLTDTIEPASPLISAWILRYSTLYALAMTGFLFVAFTSLCAYKIAREVVARDVALTASTIFLFVPAVIMTASHYSMYTDIGFTFFSSGLLFCIMKALKTGSQTWLTLSAASLSLLLLTREFAFFLLPMLAAPIIARSSRIVLRLICVPLYGATFNFLTIWDLTHSPPSVLVSILTKWVPSGVFTVVFAVLIFETRALGRLKFPLPRLAKLSLWLIPPAIFIVRNLLFYGAITFEWTPFASFSRDPVYVWIYLHTAQLFAAGTPTSALGYFRYDLLFSTVGTAAIFTLPLAVGAVFLVHRSIRSFDFSAQYLLLAFISGLLLHSYLFPQVADIRRFYLLISVPAVVLIAIGLTEIIAFLGASQQHSSSLGLLAGVLGCAIVWSTTFSPVTITKLLGMTARASTEDLQPLVLSVTLPVLIAAVYSLVASRRSQALLRSLSLTERNLLPVLVTTISVLLILSSVGPIVSDALQNGANSQTYIERNWEGGLADVIGFYNAYVHNSFATVGFYAHELIFYANRSLIDLTVPHGIAAFLPVLRANTTKAVSDALLALNVRYFLLPLPNHPKFPVYNLLRTQYLIFELIDSSPYFVVMKTFTYFRLVRFIAPQENSSLLVYASNFNKGWNVTSQYVVLTPASNGILLRGAPYELTLADDNQTQYWVTSVANSNDLFSVSNDQTQKISGANSLKITLNLTNAASLTHYFSSAINMSNYAGFSFFWFGENTLDWVPIVIQTRSWSDYFYSHFIDNFTGWRRIMIPLQSMTVHGTPTLSKISRIDILFGSLPKSTLLSFWLDDVTLTGGRYGLISQVDSAYQGTTGLFAELKVVEPLPVLNLRILLIINQYNSTSSWVSEMEPDGGGNSFFVALPKGSLSLPTRITVELVTADNELTIELLNFEIYVNSVSS